MMRSLRKNLILATVIFIVACNRMTEPVYSAFDISGWGARPTGMGGAFTAVSDDANAIFWNPAGIARMKYGEATFIHYKPYSFLNLKRWDDEKDEYVKAKLGMNYLAAAYPMGEAGSVGLGWANFSGKALYYENAISLNYARQVIGSGAVEERRRYSRGKQMDVFAGLGFKYVNHGYGMDERTLKDPVFVNGLSTSTSVSGLTMEIGCIAVIEEDISIGLAVKNIIPVNLGLMDKELLLPEIRLGGAYEVYDNITPALDILYRFGVPEAQRFNISLGCEAWFLYRTIGVRAGVNLDELGMGFSFRKLQEVTGVQADYSFNFPFRVSSHFGTHRVSITFQFGESLGLVAVEEQKNLDRRDKNALIEQYYEQGVSYYRGGNYRAAIREWRKVLMLKPNHRKAKDLINRARSKAK